MEIITQIQDWWCVPQNRVLLTVGTPSILVILAFAIHLGTME